MASLITSPRDNIDYSDPDLPRLDLIKQLDTTVVYVDNYATGP